MLEYVFVICLIFFLISVVSILISLEGDKHRRVLIDSVRESNVSASILDSFKDIILDLNFGYMGEKKNSSSVKFKKLVERLLPSDYLPKILSFKKNNIDKLWFLRVYSIQDDEVSYDVWYKDTEVNLWYFEDRRKNPQIDRSATEEETAILNNLIASIPEGKEKFLIGF